MRQVVGALLVLAMLTACGTREEAPAGHPSTASATAPASTANTEPPATLPTEAPAPPSMAGPRLRIIEPHDGDRLELPFTVRYEIDGFEVGPPPKGHLHLYVEPNAPNSYVIELPLSSAKATVTVEEGQNQLPGRRDITFWLATADHHPLEGVSAHVTIHNLIIEGPK